jgi:coproporphyrinogen III oxidase
MHPRNPHCPTMHFNYRYFEAAVSNNAAAAATAAALLRSRNLKESQDTSRTLSHKRENSTGMRR